MFFCVRKQRGRGECCAYCNEKDEEVETRRVREQLALTIQNGGLITRHDMEKHRESFLIWPTFEQNFNLQMGKSFNFI